MTPRITFDFEMRSLSDLKKEGAYKYSLDPSTQPTCLAVRLSPKVWQAFLDFKEVNRRWLLVDSQFRFMWQKAIDLHYLFSAHNAFFERCIYTNIMVRRYGWPMIPFELYRCTAAKAAACALPRNLEGAGEAMKLRIQKDRQGYSAMMQTCKPTKTWKRWKDINDRLAAGARVTDKLRAVAVGPEPKVFLDPEDAPQVFDTLYHYCRIDAKSEEELDEALPDLNESELKVWQLNQTLNWRGLRVDIPTVTKIVAIMEEEESRKLKELDTLTMGLVRKPGARQSILEFLALEGIELPDLRAKTVDDKLKGFDLSEDMRRLLEIRKALSKTSTRKYQSFLHRAGADHRVRDILMYHGASTGRDTGTGVQPHNFPRGLIRVDKKRPYAAVENVIECDADLLRVLYGESLAILFSSILRNMIIPSEGKELFVADFSKVEVAVLWWLADCARGLKILRAGLDPYKDQAAVNTGRKYQDIADEGDDRQLGKAQVLGCGFGMGAAKFKQTAWDMYRLVLTDAQAIEAVANYRNTYPEVPCLWKEYEGAAIAAVEAGPNSAMKAGKCNFVFEESFLWVTLPSGRHLAYREPQISWRESEYGPRKTLEFWAVNSKTKKWGIERTWGGTLTENIVQAVARDLMMHGIVNLEDAGYQALLTVHDEGICEKEIGKGDLEEFTRIMTDAPPWAEGLPLEAKGWKGPRYRK